MEVKYYECHITIEPVFDQGLEEFKSICASQNFRVADLLMMKSRSETAKRSNKDTFCTGHGKDYEELFQRMDCVVEEAQKSGFQVWRKKIEAILFDERLKG